MIFDIFKKKKKVNCDESKSLMLHIFSSLDSKYPNILKQINEDLISGCRSLNNPFPNYIQFSFKTDVLNKYENKADRFFAIKGIRLFDFKSNKYLEIHIYITYGILLGYSVPASQITEFDMSRVDFSRLYEYEFENDDFDELTKILDSNEILLINKSDVYKIILNDQEYYHVKDLEDGDFIGIDKLKKIYKITHDPFEILVLNKKLVDVLHDIK